MAVKVKSFPSKQELETLSSLLKYKKLYDNKQLEVLGLHDLIKKQYKNQKDLVYIGHPIPSRISEFYGDFVAGDTELMVIRVNDESQEHEKMLDEIIFENDLKEKVFDIATTQSTAGWTWLYAWLDDNSLVHIDEAAPDQVFPQNDGSIIVATYKIDPEDPMYRRLLLYTQHYQLVGEDVLIERQAFKCDEKGQAVEEIALEIMAVLLGRTLDPVSTITGLGELPFRKVSNGYKDKSDYADIIAQLAEINERVTQNSTQFLKNVDAKMQVPANVVDEDGVVKPFDYIVVESKDQPTASYITNSNPLISDAREHIMHELKTIELATGVPMWALTKGTQPERVETLRINLFNAIRKTNRKRAKLKRALQDIIRIAFKLNNVDIGKDINISFSDVIPVDESVQTDIETSKVQAGLSSRKSALMRLEGYDEAEADAELEKIKAEDAASGVEVNPPTIKPQNGDKNAQ